MAEINLVVPEEYAAKTGQLLLDGAKHARLVADYQRGLGNEDTATNAERRADALTAIASPLVEFVEAEKAARIAERKAKLQASKKVKEAKKKASK